MPHSGTPELADLFGKCVIIKYANGNTLAGFLQAIDGNLLTLFVAGKIVFVPLFNVTEIRRAEGLAC